MNRPARLNFPVHQGQSKPGLLLWGALAVFMLVLCGASIAVLGLLAWAVWFAFAAALLLLIFLASVPENGRDVLLFAAMIGWFGLPLLQKTLGLDLYAYWQVFLLGAAFLGFAKFGRAVSSSSLLTVGVILFGLYTALGLLSSYLGRTVPMAGLYQFLSNLKPLMLIVLGYALAWGRTTEQIFWMIVRWFWAYALVFVVFGWVAPGLYQHAFPFPGRPSPDASGLFPSRALGPFVHPSFLSSTSAVFGLLCIAKYILDPTRRSAYLALSLIYAVLLITSVGRQEIAAFVLAAAFAFLLARPKQYLQRVIVAGVLVAAGSLMFWLAFGDYIVRESAAWGFNSLGKFDHPRAQIIYGSVLIAMRYFPIGSGLGTYGGAGAMKFDHSLYYELGFRQYWWFERQGYLMDTYWPNSLAEAGVIGAVFLAAFYVVLWLFATVRSVHATGSGRLYWIAAASGMIYMLALSFTSPSFQDPRLFLIPALMFGIATQLDGRQHRVSQGNLAIRSA